MKANCFLHGEYECGDRPGPCLRCEQMRIEHPACTWTYDDDRASGPCSFYGGHWDTECGESFHFEDGCKPGEQSRIRFCCYCGKEIRV